MVSALVFDRPLCLTSQAHLGVLAVGRGSDMDRAPPLPLLLHVFTVWSYDGRVDVSPVTQH